ncbi:DUF7363 domain-containing protein [Rhodococcus opacus]|uniref:DUF7363 domain-containing protein n=1 Tax=Rhodococcus opacus TaxID=37919 RepID=UPI002953C09A|nr:CHAT domain-containing protein [Rhodococcus opacus]MDV7088624.1 CHAT domain-containing protein [Rhodococcus opacus]
MPALNIDTRIADASAPGWSIHAETLDPALLRLQLPGVRGCTTHAVRLSLTPTRPRNRSAGLLLRVSVEPGEVVVVADEGKVNAGTEPALLARTRASDSPDYGETELELGVALPAAGPPRLLVVWYLPVELATADGGSPTAALPMPIPTLSAEDAEPELIIEGDAVDAFIAADLPPVLQTGVAVTLTVRLSRQELDDVAGRRNAQDPIRIDPRRKVRVKLRRQNLRVVPGTRDRLDFDYPATGTIATGVFHVIGVEPGDAVAWLMVFQTEVFPLATLRLDVTVTTDVVADTNSLVTGRAAFQRLDPRLRNVPVLAVHEDVVDGRSTLTFELKLPNGRRRTYTGRPRPDKAEYLAGLYNRIEALWDRHKSKPSVEVRRRAFDADLAQYGVEMAADFLPSALRSDLRTNWDRLDGLALITTETDIPWEVVAVEADEDSKSGPRFLGEKGMTRWLCEGDHPIALTLRRGHRRFLCPEYRSEKYRLPHLVLERDLLTTGLEADEITPGAADELGRQLHTRDFDLLHFGGHGDIEMRDGVPSQRLLLAEFDEDIPSEAAVYRAGRLTKDYARPHPALPEPAPEIERKTGPVVVLNACRVGRSARTGIEAFAPALLTGGAAIVLGCLWRIEDDAATDFVRTFYDELGKKCTMAEALATARSTVRRRGNASWLAYSLYSHPFATVDFHTDNPQDREDTP